MSEKPDITCYSHEGAKLQLVFSKGSESDTLSIREYDPENPEDETAEEFVVTGRKRISALCVLFEDLIGDLIE